MDVLNQGLSKQEQENLYMGSELVMMWHCQKDTRFSFHTYVPPKIREDPTQKFRVMSFVHGTGRTIEKYRELFIKFADANNLALIFPMFPGGLFEKNDFNSYKLLAYRGIRYDNIFLAMIDEFAERFPQIDTEKIFLYGWSGGGQFVHRFLYTHPERLAALMVGAPGRITYLDSNTPYFWGTKDFEKIFGTKINLEAIRKVPICLLIGEKDTLPIGKSPWGNTRMERILNLKKNWEEHEIPVSMKVIPGIAHKGNDAIKAPYVMDFFQKVMDSEKS